MATFLGEQGRTGLRHWSGHVDEEWLRRLKGRQGRKLYKEMEDNDPVIGAFLYAIEYLARQLSWSAMPAENGDTEPADFLEECIEDMSQGWSFTLAEILSMLVYGFSVHEIVYKTRNGPEQADGAHRSRYTDGRYGWRKWPIRAQETIDRWVFGEDGGLDGVVQCLDGKYVTIPTQKLLLFRTTTHKGNPEGKSVLRRAVRPWTFKKRIEEIEGIGVERDLAGLPVIRAPKSIMMGNASAEEKALYTELKRIAVNIRRDEQEGLVMPSDRDVNNNLMYELELLSTGGARQFGTSDIINRYDQRITMSVLADFIMLGHTKVGTQELAQDKMDLFRSAMRAYLDGVKEVINRFAIPRLWRLNGMDLTAIPEWDYTGLDRVDLGELGEYVSKLAGAGAELFPDEELENTLRSKADLPDKDLSAEPLPVEPLPPEPPPPEQIAKTPDIHLTIPEQKAPEVTVNIPLTEVTVEKGEVTVPSQKPPVVNVSVPEQKPPVVNVSVPPAEVRIPSQKPPVVNVSVPTPQVNVSVPDPKDKKITLTRDRNGDLIGETETK